MMKPSDGMLKPVDRYNLLYSYSSNNDWKNHWAGKIGKRNQTVWKNISDSVFNHGNFLRCPAVCADRTDSCIV